jgi:hypothetical protein
MSSSVGSSTDQHTSTLQRRHRHLGAKYGGGNSLLGSSNAALADLATGLLASCGSEEFGRRVAAAGRDWLASQACAHICRFMAGASDSVVRHWPDTASSEQIVGMTVCRGAPTDRRWPGQ